MEIIARRISDTSGHNRSSPGLQVKKTGTFGKGAITSHCEPRTTQVMAREDKLVYGHELTISVDRFLFDSILAYALVCPEYLRLAVGIAREGFGSHNDESPLDTSSIRYHRLLPFPVFSFTPIHDGAGFGEYVGSIDICDDLFVVFLRFAVSFCNFECHSQCGACLCSFVMQCSQPHSHDDDDDSALRSVCRPASK